MIIRKDALEEIEDNLSKVAPNAETIARLDKLREALKKTKGKIEVCVGPNDSGTQAIARAVIKLHNLEDHIEDYTNPLQLPVSDMVERLHAGTLDAGFFVSYVPTGALRSVVADEAFRLLSLGSRELRLMQSGVFKMSTIDPDTYPCQKGQEISTIATRTVLVTTLDLPKQFPVRDITEAIFKGEAYLGIEGLTKIAMARRLPSLSLHPGADKHYKTEEDLGLNPPSMHWLRQTWTILGCLTMLITVMFIPGYTGVIILRRNRTANAIGRRILAIPTEASFRDSVERLLKIRAEIQERVRRRWWRWGELDKHRWRYLRDLIHDRIGEAKENLTRAFVTEIRAVTNATELTNAERRKQCRSIENCILEFFEKAELDPSQQKILRELVRDVNQQLATSSASRQDQKLTDTGSPRVVDLPAKSQG
ncbi:MAG: TAXI family TRAP transporter solute-binding subunit, partial [Planctomycetota bacterium]